MAWTAPEVLAASSGCVGRALMGLPSESRTGAPCSGAGAGARCVAGDCMLRPAPGDRTPARDICRRRGGCYALRTLLASSPKFCFRAAVGWAARAPGLAWGVPRRRRRLRGARGCPPKPENQVKPRWCSFRGKGRFRRHGEPWRGRGAPGEGCGGDAFANPVLLAKANAARKISAAFDRAWASGFTPRRLRSAAC